VIRSTVLKLSAALTERDLTALIVLEPSCLSAMLDDWRSLKLDLPASMVERIAGPAVLAEQFIDRGWGRHPRGAGFDAHGVRHARLHVHCHQKALWGEESTAGLMRGLLGDRLQIPDAGCCGMAGAFGMRVSTYDLSMKIGERVLLPAVRRLEAGAVVLATGTSCRHQIRDGAGAAALHPVELLERCLG